MHDFFFNFLFREKGKLVQTMRNIRITVRIIGRRIRTRVCVFGFISLVLKEQIQFIDYKRLWTQNLPLPAHTTRIRAFVTELEVILSE